MDSTSNYSEHRAVLLSSLQQSDYDIVVIGGGASGCGVALEASLRGYSVLLIEAFDLASGASSASTKLVHGGVRYLEKAIRELDWGQYKLVQEALHERVRMLHNAPHLAHPVEIIIPVYHWWEIWYYRIGLWLYDLISGDKRWPNSRVISAKEVLQKIPEINPAKIVGGILYYDGQFNDSRYAVALARAAQAKGAKILTYASCVEVVKNERNQITAIKVRDNLGTQEVFVRTKWIINCSGSNSDKIRQLSRPGVLPRLRPSKGVHLVFPKTLLKNQTGMLIPKTRDGRVIFLLPWQESVLFGTTDTAVSDPFARPEADQEDISYLMSYFKEVMAPEFHHYAYQSVFAGNRPLVTKDSDEPTEALIRSHEVEVWQPEQIIHLLGGKWTTYRQMAEDTLNALAKVTDASIQKNITAAYPLQETAGSPKILGSVPLDIQLHLNQYGSDYQWFVNFWEHYGMTRLCEQHPFTTADVVFACAFEFALTIEDVLDRRLRLETINAQVAYSVAPLVAATIHQWFPNVLPNPSHSTQEYQAKLGKKYPFLISS